MGCDKDLHVIVCTIDGMGNMLYCANTLDPDITWEQGIDQSDKYVCLPPDDAELLFESCALGRGKD